MLNIDLTNPSITIVEVLSQAPNYVIEQANTFEIIESPKTYEDFRKYQRLVDNHYDLSKVRAYKMHK